MQWYSLPGESPGCYCEKPTPYLDTGSGPETHAGIRVLNERLGQWNPEPGWGQVIGFPDLRHVC
jgi:hypothetical protein